MNPEALISWTAATLSMLLAVAVPFRRHSTAAWLFAAGMVVLAVECALAGLSFSKASIPEAARIHSALLQAGALIPFTWIAFSLSYLRLDYSYYLRRWGIVLGLALVVPVGLATGLFGPLATVEPMEGGGWFVSHQWAGTGINVAVLLTAVVVFYNLERTLRAAVGTNRWKVKFALLGIGVIFGARIYTRSQALLYHAVDSHCTFVDVSGVLVGCILMTIALVRQGLAAADMYLSRSVLQSSVTLVLAGGYLLILGVLAKMATALGGGMQFVSAILLLGCTFLAILLLSDRLRQRLRSFVERNFRRPQHDSRALWAALTNRLSGSAELRAYALGAANLLAESFQVLSVTVWAADDIADRLIPVASTADDNAQFSSNEIGIEPAAPVLDGLRTVRKPFNPDDQDASWLADLKTAAQGRFPKGGHPLCLPLIASGRPLGVITLADRVNGESYTTEDLDLLGCIADQVAAGLLRFQLTEELIRAREMEAFQAMSTFLIHDLKNATSSLTLTLQNLPVHFDNPEFRRDALKSIGAAVSRMNQITGKLGTLRQKFQLHQETTEINPLLQEVAAGVAVPSGITLSQSLHPVPPVMADRSHLESVVTNLLVNAREAIPASGGRISLTSSVQGTHALISVSDSGCGMTASFIRNSLFRPFCTTKNSGLGIGMFQCRAIVLAHGGSLQVESKPGEGTTVRIFLPLCQSAS